jgi:hypothetical protein
MQYSESQIKELLRQAGFPESAIPTMVKIAQLESTNNTRAFNPEGRDLSYGLFQINMKDDDPRNPNMGKERRKWFGLKSNEELYDPLTNAKAAYKLWSSKEKQGKNKGFTHWSTYNEQIAGNPNLRIINKGAQGMEASATTGDNKNFNPFTGVSNEMIARAYLTDPELAEVFKPFLNRTGSEVEDELLRAISTSRWAAKNSADINSRVAETLSLSTVDYQRKLELEIRLIMKQAGELGAQNLSADKIKEIATSKLLFGWDSTKTQEVLLDTISLDKTFLAGKFGTVSDSLYKGIQDYGYKVDPKSPEFVNNVKSVIRGNKTEADVINQFRNMAINDYPQFADRLKAGATITSITAGPKWTIANLLELDYGTITNDNPYVQKYLSAGGMNNFDLERTIKADPNSGARYTKGIQNELITAFDEFATATGFMGV